MKRSPGAAAAAGLIFLFAGCLSPFPPRPEEPGSEPGARPENELERQDGVEEVSRNTASGETPGPGDRSTGVEVELGEMAEGDLPGKSRPIDLPTVLRLAGADSIEVKIYQQKLQASQADLDAAGARFLPDLEIGVGYLRHDGRLQETRGEVFDVSRSSLGAGPLVRLHADPAEAFFERLAAREAATAAAHGEARVRAETMVNAGLLYLGLLEGRALLEVARETVAHSREHAELTERAVELQAELRVNLARAQAALARDEQQLLAAQTNLRRASVDLAVLLRLSPTVFLLPTEETIQPMTLVDPETPLASLVDRALGSRPDLREVEALSRAADEHLSAEELSPWFPEIDLFVVYGRYGGGRGSDFQDFGDRLDAGATLSWTLEGLGLGVGARRRRARAEAREAALEVEGLRERVVGQVIRSWEQVRSLRARIGAADSGVRAASTALELVRDRLASGDAIQLEILEAIQEVAASRAALVHAIVEYGKAQHVLYYQVHGAAWER